MSAFGVVVRSDVWLAGTEAYSAQILAGIEDVAIAEGHTVISQALTTLEEELAIYREWTAQGTVDAVVLRDLRREDPRPPLLEELGLPAVLIGDVAQDEGIASVLVDNGATMDALLVELDSMGLVPAAHIGGPQHLLHSQLRRAAYEQHAADEGCASLTAEGDYSALSGRAAMRGLLMPDVASGALDAAPGEAIRPRAVIADNDMMAVAAVEAARSLGLRVPEDIAVISWDDSTACQLNDPPLAALAHTPRVTGTLVGEALIGAVSETPQIERVQVGLPRLLRRASLQQTAYASSAPAR